MKSSEANASWSDWVSNTVFSARAKRDASQDVLGVPWASDSTPKTPGPFITVIIDNIVWDSLHFLPSNRIAEAQTGVGF